jgi:hypothetical protein
LFFREGRKSGMLKKERLPEIAASFVAGIAEDAAFPGTFACSKRREQ